MDNTYLQAAIAEARRGLEEGGIPIGSVLVIDGEIVGRGHNRRVQKGSAILHAEMDCLENAAHVGRNRLHRVPTPDPVWRNPKRRFRPTPEPWP
jgi:cytosine deaminase